MGIFNWLTGKLTGKKDKDTEIRRLKAAIQEEIKNTCAAAKKGDSCAALKLEALKVTLEENSVRLTGNKRPPSTRMLPPGAVRGLLFVCIALVLPACATTSDAVLVDQTEKAGEYIEQHSIQPDVAQAGKDVALNSKTIKKNVTGDAPAELKKPYTPQNSAEARKGSDDSHTSKLWPWISGALALLLPIAIGVAKMHPWGAVIARIAEPYVQKLVAVRDAAESNPDDIVHRDHIDGHIDDLLMNSVTGAVTAKLITKASLEQEPQTA